MRRARLIGLALVVLALVSSGAVLAASPKGSLKVTYWPHGPSAAWKTWTLRCNPVSGTHPLRRLACSTLRKHASELLPATRPCVLHPTATSPLAVVKGTWAGRKVDRAYRTGCPGWKDLHVVLTGKA